MSGPWPVILSVVAMTVLIYVAARVFSRARETSRVHCAERKADFDVTFDCKLGPLWTAGRRQDVVRCSAFADPDHPDCAKGCLAPTA